MKSLLAVLLLTVTAQVYAGTITYTKDTFLDSWNSPNSGNDAEQQALANILGIDFDDLSLTRKEDTPTAAGPFQNYDTTDQWYLDTAPLEPGYFALKFGTGGTNVSVDTFFFQNIGELTKLVWADADVLGLSGSIGCKNCNIGRLSHYTAFDSSGAPTTITTTTTATPTATPTASSILLLGLGLLGLGRMRTRLSESAEALRLSSMPVG